MGQIHRGSGKDGFRRLADSAKEAAAACEKDTCSKEVFRNDLLNALSENAEEFLKAGLDDHVQHEALDVPARKARVVLERDSVTRGNVFSDGRPFLDFEFLSAGDRDA